MTHSVESSQIFLVGIGKPREYHVSHWQWVSERVKLTSVQITNRAKVQKTKIERKHIITYRRIVLQVDADDVNANEDMGLKSINPQEYLRVVILVLLVKCYDIKVKSAE